MIRIIVILLLVFLLPFAFYALYVKFRIARGTMQANPWQREILYWLVLTGSLLVIGGFLVLSNLSGEKPGAVYRPAEIIDGKIRPGGFERPEKAE